MAGHDVFISYSTLDKPTADAVCHGLEAEGVRCWIAPRDVTPGMDWQQSLLDAIAAARAVVLVFTGNANASANVRKEITAAFEGGAVVIPFRLEDIEPQGSLRYHLTGVHWMDALTPPLEAHVRQLAGSVKRVLGRDGDAGLPPPPPPPPPPPEDRSSQQSKVGLLDSSRGAAGGAVKGTGGAPNWLLPAAIGGGIVAVILFVLLLVAGAMMGGDSGSGSASASGVSASSIAASSASPVSASASAGATPAATQPSPERLAAIAALRATPEDAREIDNELQPVANGPPTSIQGGSVVTTQQLVLALANPQHLPQITLVDALGCADHVSIPTARCASTSENIAQLLTAAQIEQDAPVVFFCHGPDCPNSYVMALSAIQAGWSNVFWYRGGLRAWQSLNGPTATPTPLDPNAGSSVTDQQVDMGQGAGGQAPTN